MSSLDDFRELLHLGEVDAGKAAGIGVLLLLLQLHTGDDAAKFASEIKGNGDHRARDDAERAIDQLRVVGVLVDLVFANGVLARCYKASRIELQSATP